MKILADMNISPLTIMELTNHGYQISRITAYLPANATDEEIIQLALQENWIILTQDLDFSALIAQSGSKYPSLISIRLNNAQPKVISKILLNLLPTIEEELLQGALISVDEKNFRIRHLPVIK